MATLTTSSRSPSLLNPKAPFSPPRRHTSLLPKPTSLTLSHQKPFALLLRNHHLHLSYKTHLPKIRASTTTPPISPIPNATRTITSSFTTILAVSKLLLTKIRSISQTLSPTPEELLNLQTLKQSLVCSIGPLFFAAIRTRSTAHLNTPLTVVASGMAKWLRIYSGVLLVRILLSWFPNIPWDRQPLSALRDLCDPYLSLFRNIIPPLFNALDVSPILAFSVLGVLGTILNNSRY